MKVVNVFGGPCSGKSTIAAGLFSDLKFDGHNTELITEYAKEAAWEGRSQKFFRSQELLFGKQHFRLNIAATETEFCITDSPLLLCAIYMPKDYHLPSLKRAIFESHFAYESLNIFVERSFSREFCKSGRTHNLEEALLLDKEILDLLVKNNIDFHSVKFGREAIQEIVSLMKQRNWI